MIKYALIAAACLMVVAQAQLYYQPQQHYQPHHHVAAVVEVKKLPKDIVVNEINENDGSGHFYTYRETLDGGRSEQIGFLDEYGKQVIHGAYTEITPEGPKTVQFVADRTGYHPRGAHLPK